MVKVDIYGLMEVYIMEHGKIIVLVVLEYMNG